MAKAIIPIMVFDYPAGVTVITSVGNLRDRNLFCPDHLTHWQLGLNDRSPNEIKDRVPMASDRSK